jgi:hypothetical protein
MQCTSVTVNMWRESALLLRALWDAVPDVRPLHLRLLEDMEDFIEDQRRYAYTG